MTDVIGHEGAARRRVRHPVLTVFGIKLAVSNPRLAALLTMDAREALTTDVRVLGRALAGPGAADALERGGEDSPEESSLTDRRPTSAATPDTPGRRDFRMLAREAGFALGFDASRGAMWLSPKGVMVIVGIVDRPVSFAAASHLVREMDARRTSIANGEITALFIVDDTGTTDVFKVAVRAEHLADAIRIIALDDLLELRRLAEFGVIDHDQALVLLVPMSTVDVGELLSIVRTSRVHELPEMLA